MKRAGGWILRSPCLVFARDSKVSRVPTFQGAKMDSNRRVPSHPRDNDIVTSLNAPLHANLILQSGILEVTVYNPAFSARNMDQ